MQYFTKLRFMRRNQYVIIYIQSTFKVSEITFTGIDEQKYSLATFSIYHLKTTLSTF